MMSTRYFFFGTLMDRDVLELVLGRPVEDGSLRPATLDGYRRLRVRRDTFPMLVEDAEGRVEGVVFETRSGEEDARILFFEDYDYDLAACRPTTEDGPTEAMFCGIDAGIEASDEPWLLDAWAARHKAGFLELSRIYMACFGRMTPQEAEPIWEEGRLALVAKGLL